MKNLYASFLDSLYPKKEHCILCGRENSENLCSYCASTIEFIHDRRCIKCGKGLKDSYADNICSDCKERSFSFRAAYSCFLYKGGGKEAIHRLKYDGKKAGGKVLAKFMADIIVKEDLNGDVIIPVPIHKSKMSIRGFNQSYIIGKHLSRYISLPVYSCLKRVRITKEQYNLDKTERMINVNNAFKFDMLYDIRNKRVLLIDDVFTTGSTVEECSKLLIGAGASDVYVVTAASGRNIE